jgi:hypothetical protein
VDYDLEWAPFVHGLYVATTDGVAREHGYGFASQARCGVLEEGAPLIDAPVSTGLTAWWSLEPLESFRLDPEGEPAVAGPSPAVDTCVGLGDPLTAGTYLFAGSNTGFSDDIALPEPSCTGYDSFGGEGLISVRVGAGERLTAAYTSVDDGAVYLLAECSDAGSCVAGADSELERRTERLDWMNEGEEVSLTLVLDCYGMPCGDYTLELDIF